MRSIVRPALAGAVLVAVTAVVGCAPTAGGSLAVAAETDAAGRSVAQALRAGELPAAATLEAEVREALAGTGIPGGAILLTDESEDRRIVIFGEAAAGEPVTAMTRFAYRSVTKSFVGTVVLQLVDEGLVRLDAPITDYLPTLELADPPTVRQLGAMRSGIANYSAAPDLITRLLDDPGREPSADELISPALPSTPVFSPDAEYEYSNTNTLLLGELIEAVTGNDWTAEVADRLLRPLGLTTVTYGFPDDAPAAVPVQIAEDGGLDALPAAAPGWFGAAGGLTGDVADLAAWGRALGSGTGLSDAAFSARIDALGPIADDPRSPRYDEYGFAICGIDGWIGHTGAGLGFQSLTVYEPDTGLTVAIVLRGTGTDQNVPADVLTALVN